MEIRYENVSKRFDGTPALSNFDIHVADGTFLVLLGPSGCGKTTAMRIAAGLEEPTEGRVYIGDRDVTDLPPRSRDIAMVFQSYALYPQMTVAENIGYPLRIRKTPKPQIKAEVERVAAVLDLQPYLARKPKALSGGQRQRVALARAIIRQPVAFLMDEPLSNLDAQLRAQMRTEIKRLQQEFAVTTLYVTHDQVEAMTMADQVAIMRSGILQQLAPPQVLYSEPANTFVAKFVGSPPMNIISGTITDGLFRGSAGTLSTSTAHRGDVQLGFRPEAVALADPSSDSAQLQGSVYAVEPLGNEVIVAFQLGTDIVHGRLPADTQVQVGQNWGLRIEATKTHLFDPKDGTRIAGASTPTTDNLVTQREMA